MKKQITSLVVLGTFLFLAFGSAEEGPETKSNREKYGDKISAWVAAEQFIENQLKSPSTADFGWQSTDECVTDLGGGTYRVKGWVDAQNAFGATVRTDFVLTVRCTGNDRWQLVEGPIVQQR